MIRLELSAREARIVAVLRARLGVGTDDDVARLALYRYAEFCGIQGLQLTDFEVGHGTRAGQAARRGRRGRVAS